MSQRLNSFLGASPELRQLARQVGKLRALQRQYEQFAPPSLLRASRVQQLEQNILTLAADNSAVAAKLRQLAPELLQQFQDKGCEATAIQIQVQIAVAPAKPAVTPPMLSPAGRQRLTELATELPDSPLKNALQRLARIKTGSGK